MSKKASKNTPAKSRKSGGESKDIYSRSVKKGTSGYDFAARVRKCCISWHECIQKWDSTNTTGLEIATKVVNVQLQKASEEQDESQGSSLQPFNNAKFTNDSDELQQDKEKFVHIFESLKEIQGKMKSLTSNFEAMSSLHQMKEGESKKGQAIFETWPLENYVNLSRKLAEMFEKEIRLKEKLVRMLVKEANNEERSKLMSCLAMWLHQPYLQDDYRQELELMLLETGLRTL